MFAFDANTLAPGSVFSHVGGILFNMVVNPVTGKLYVTNIESSNHVRFEGPGIYGGSTVQGHLSETRISVLDPGKVTVDSQHLNQHIQYDRLHTDVPDLVDTTQKNHSLATPLQAVVSSDGHTVYMAAFGSAKIGVFDAADLEDPLFEAPFDPTAESDTYIDTDGGPAGIILDEANGRLYVLTRYSDRGSPMTSKCTAQLLADLGVTRSLSRPQVSHDNPFSEAQFKTLKYHPGFPGRFLGIDHATSYCRSFIPRYNTEHRHGGIAADTTRRSLRQSAGDPCTTPTNHGRSLGGSSRTLR